MPYSTMRTVVPEHADVHSNCISARTPSSVLPVDFTSASFSPSCSALFVGHSCVMHSFWRADDDFLDEGTPDVDAADDGSDPPSPLLLELRAPNAPPPDWNLARDPVPDMVWLQDLAASVIGIM